MIISLVVIEISQRLSISVQTSMFRNLNIGITFVLKSTDLNLFGLNSVFLSFNCLFSFMNIEFTKFV